MAFDPGHAYRERGTLLEIDLEEGRGGADEDLGDGVEGRECRIRSHSAVRPSNRKSAFQNKKSGCAIYLTCFHFLSSFANGQYFHYLPFQILEALIEKQQHDASR
jgi:hypothetical protein